MKKLAIEYAHIYTNSHINEEHEFSISVLEEITKDISKEDYSLVLLVDDYSFPDPSFNYQNLRIRLESNWFSPDVLIRESQLIPYCDEVLNSITDIKLKNNIQDYIISKKKYPCSLFIATRYLIRLWSISTSLYAKEFIAESTLSILPESFKPFEDKWLRIIKNSIFQWESDKISVRYFEWRIIW